ncbi:MAG TPA: PAS domain S-box protein [Bacillus bacterium]|nr:PAS domain S-box protein [Bacillus sp. (in: firmicutes)]
MSQELQSYFDLATALAYFSIPITMLVFFRKRRIPEFRLVFICCVLFVMFCGITHLMHLIQLINPTKTVQSFNGVVTVLTAFISTATAILFWWILPKALLIPSPAELKKINKLLLKEIDNHKKTTQKLQYLNAIMESSNDAIVGVSMEGKISSWNLGASEIFGYTKDEMIGESYCKLLPSGQMEEMKKILRKTLEGERLIHLEIDHIDKNDSIINGSLTVSPVKFDAVENEIVGISVIIRNLTVKKKFQEEMNRLTQLKTVSEIAASISHEVRNPLTVTRGFTQLLKDNSLTDDQRNQYIRLSLDELDRAERIIGDYLTFAKPSIENVEILDLTKELEYIIQVINPYATLNNISVEVNMVDGEVPIFGEKQKLHQSLLNIVKNGIEAMEEGGQLTIQLKKMEENVLLEIKDSGKGMSAEQIQKLGTPYYSTKEKGTGLGTMVAFSIIKAMQGEFEVESKLGEGTCFHISFPLVEFDK